MRCAIVGSTGAVGNALLPLLREWGKEPLLFRSQSEISFEGIDLAFFCVPSNQAKELIPKALEKKVVCIDSSSAFRRDPRVPLVIPEINPKALQNHNGLISSPNCTTTLMLLPLTPLHKAFKIKRIVAATYQAVSGAGAKGIDELIASTAAYLEGKVVSPSLFPYPCAFNVFPHESELLPSGYVEEEEKMVEETHKILDDASIAISATCARVPVLRVHSLALNVEFSLPFKLNEAIHLLEDAPGVRLCTHFSALDASGEKEVLCARVRVDPFNPLILSMWVAGDQLLKGAALNMLQIAKILC